MDVIAHNLGQDASEQDVVAVYRQFIQQYGSDVTLANIRLFLDEREQMQNISTKQLSIFARCRSALSRLFTKKKKD